MAVRVAYQAYGPHGLWYEQGRENFSKFERPYGYSPFFIFGNHKSIEGAECCYSDRYRLWGQEKYDAACAAAGINGIHGSVTRAAVDAFVKAYHGNEFSVVGMVEWCNVSNGYPCWSIHFKKVEVR